MTERVVAVPALHPYYDYPRIATLALSAEGSQIAYSAHSKLGVELHVCRIDGTEDRTLDTFAAIHAIAWARDTIVFSSDASGHEKQQLFGIDPSTLASRQFSTEPRAQHLIHHACVSPDGTQVAFAANLSSPANFGVHVLDTPSGVSRCLVAKEGFFLPARWSPDGRSLLVAELHAVDANDLWLLELATGSFQRLTATQAGTWYSPADWEPGGDAFWATADAAGPWKAGGRVHRSGRFEALIEPDCDVVAVALSKSGQHLAWVEERNAEQSLRIKDLRTGQLLDTSGVLAGVLVNPRFSDLVFAADDRLVFFLEHWGSPRNIHALDLTGTRSLRLTQALPGAPLPGVLVEPELVHYPSADGSSVPALLYRPSSGPEPSAVVVYVHGGPHASERKDWSPLFQYLAARGVAVLAPNYRGSVGFGRDWARQIDGDWGGADLDDVEYAIHFLRNEAWADASRVAVMGISYGGFSALACVARAPHAWAAAVSLFGPVDLVALCQHVPPAWRRFLEPLTKQPELLRERSPSTRLADIRCPVMLVQGGHDARTPRQASDDFVTALRARGIRVEYTVLEDEGHGFGSVQSEVETFSAAAQFLIEALGVA